MATSASMAVASAGIAVCGIGLASSVTAGSIYLAEHKNNARPSTRNKHEEGQTRKNRDKGGEKGDKRKNPILTKDAPII